MISDQIAYEQIEKQPAVATNYPRPRFVRRRWKTLDGSWGFSVCDALTPDEVNWERRVQVPYPPESSRSEVGEQDFHLVVWYRRNFEIPNEWREQRVTLHFGAVDYEARVWVNGQLVVSHEGGHTPFSADITDVLVEGEQEVVVRAKDDPADMRKPRGKQDWQREPHGIWYPRTTGIWQSVWLEPVSETHLSHVRFTPNLERFGVQLEVDIASFTEELELSVTFTLGDTRLIDDTVRLSEVRVERFVSFPDPGIDDARQAYLWSPEHPNLIDVELKLYQGDTLLDKVKSYTGLRSVEARDGKFFLNGRPYFLRLALDQGYWDESLMTAPSGEALKKDVELAKAMGFNGVRKHQKVEDPRYLYWADKLGLLVWEELPSAYSFSGEAVTRLMKEWLEVIQRDASHPCITTWVCFNESWGVPDLPRSEVQRQAVKALYHLTKALDPSRPVVGNDGWEHVVTDLLTIHDYSRAPEMLKARYGTPEASRHTSTQFLEHGRALTLSEMNFSDQPIILSEFGGIRFHPEAEGWGYQQVESAEDLIKLYAEMICAVSSSGLAGFCYTQFADTFQEQNGLLYSDRTPKVALERLSEATRAQTVPEEE